MRENNTWREGGREGERGEKKDLKLNAGHGRVNTCTRIMATEYPVICHNTVKPLITDSPSNGQPPYNGLMSWHRLLLPYI